MRQYFEIIKEGNYTEGLGNDVGWYNSGHGGYVGAKAMQGLMAYYYDHVRDDAVELNPVLVEYTPGNLADVP